MTLFSGDHLPWRNWFAWYPVPVSPKADGAMNWIWGCWVERRGPYGLGMALCYDYRLPGTVVYASTVDFE